MRFSRWRQRDDRSSARRLATPTAEERTIVVALGAWPSTSA